MTRKAVRSRLVTLFAGQGFNVVNGFAPTDLNGADKVLNIYSRNSTRDMISAGLTNDFYTFNLDVLVKRAGAAADEDALDDLHEAIITVIKNNIGDSTWSHLELTEQSEAVFAEVAGIPYRLERHPLVVKATS